MENNIDKNTGEVYLIQDGKNIILSEERIKVGVLLLLWKLRRITPKS